MCKLFHTVFVNEMVDNMSKGIIIILLLSIQYISCENFNNLDVINLKSLHKIEVSYYGGPVNKEVLRFFPHITELVIKNCDINLDTNFFESVPRLRKLTLIDNKIIKHESNMTGCCEYFKELYMINNHMNDLRIDKVGMITQFVIVITGENVPVMKKGIFVRSPRIKQMNITYSNLETIEKGVFDGLKEMTILNLEGNKLRSLADGLLEPLEALKVLILKGNLLEAFSGDSVQNLPWLRFIDISHNPVKKLTIGDIKDQAIRLKEIWVAGINGTNKDVIRF